MVGHNVLLVAKADGHSPHTMLTTYAAWAEGANETDGEAIRRAMERSPERACTVSIAAPDRPLQSPGFATRLPLEPEREEEPRQWGRLSWRKIKHFGLAKNGGADGTRTRDPRRDRPVF